MTDIESWRERLAARAEETLRQQAAASTARRDRRRRRAHGMVDRHAGRLARRRGGRPRPGPPVAEGPESRPPVADGPESGTGASIPDG